MQQQGWLCLRRASGALVLVCVTAVAGADTLPVAADGQINLAAPNVKGGALGTLSVASGRPAGDMKGLALFDLSALPPGAAVQKATLRMWVDAVLDPGPLDVLPILDPWREATLSASVAPRFGVSVASVPVAASNEGRYLNVDVTSLVQDWVSGALDNNGLALEGGSADPVRVRFDSKENTAESHPMEIEVALGLPPGVGDVTAVSAGFGLTGGGTAGDLTIAADPLVLQARVSGVCPLGAAVHGVRADGSVDCQPAVGGVFADLPLEVQRGADSVLITVAPGTVGTREIDLPAISNGDDGTLVAGETFLFGTGLFGSQGTRCLVTTVAQVFDLAAKTTNGPVLRIGSKHGTDAPADDGSFGVTFPAKPAGAISQPVSWTRLVSVPADGELLLLGCALASPGADWVGAYVVCNTTFVCF